MIMHELLVPAGDMECLRQAIFNGCDAVYLACKNFGARKFATNFTNDEIVDAIKLCHLYGVKIYVTMNTLVKNEEVDSFIEQASFLHKSGVDALIVQDFGMICLLRKMFPNLEIHASTQANTSSKETCQLFYDLGVKRVVFSREVSIDEIDSIDIPIEKEAFIHGALCISYSGCCLMSSMLGGRSGNRGECAGTCRMPYSLEENKKIVKRKEYLLSTKELNTTLEIERLKKSSIYSFKIEGRMKGPLYVGFITRLYRRLLDGEKVDLSFELDRLRTIFNREYTKGRLFNESDSKLMNVKTPNHVGLRIGKVVDISKDKIKIELDDGKELNQFDAIRFLNSKRGLVVNFLYDENKKLINSSKKYCYIDNKINLERKDIVYKTQDYLLKKEFLNLENRKINIVFKVRAKLNMALAITISDGINEFTLEENVISKAEKIPIKYEDIVEKLNRLGDTPFTMKNCQIEIDNNIFIPVKSINEMRRKLIDLLIDARSNKKVNFIKNNVLFDKDNDFTYDNSFKVCCLVRNKNQLDFCLKSNVDRVYVIDRELYELYKNNEKVYLLIDRCSFNISDKLVKNNIVSEYFYFPKNSIGNYSLNVTNIYSAYYLKKLGLRVIPLSVELNDLEIEKFIEEYHNKFGFALFEIFIYGRVCNMIIKGNILDIKKQSYEYNLIDFKDRRFPVYFDGVNTFIYNYENRLNFKKIKYCSYRLDFYNESEESIKKIFRSINY